MNIILIECNIFKLLIIILLLFLFYLEEVLTQVCRFQRQIYIFFDIEQADFFLKGLVCINNTNLMVYIYPYSFIFFFILIYDFCLMALNLINNHKNVKITQFCR